MRGQFKSGRFRKIFVRTPGAKTVIHYRERKPKAAVCPSTGQKLPGVPRERPAYIRKLSKSQRKPERPYGGMLSGQAMREVMRRKAHELMKKLRGDV